MDFIEIHKLKRRNKRFHAIQKSMPQKLQVLQRFWNNSRRFSDSESNPFTFINLKDHRNFKDSKDTNVTKI